MEEGLGTAREVQRRLIKGTVIRKPGVHIGDFQQGERKFLELGEDIVRI